MHTHLFEPKAYLFYCNNNHKYSNRNIRYFYFLDKRNLKCMIFLFPIGY